MHRPTPSFFVSVLALVVALGGTSYAVAQLPSKSVGAAQLKAGAVTSAKVKDRSLRAKDFAQGELPSPSSGLPGPAGPAGPAGAAGARGPAGPAASGAASLNRSPGFHLTRDLGAVEMFSLSQWADVRTGPVPVTTPSRLVVTATANVYFPTDRSISCSVEHREGAGAWRQLGVTGTQSGPQQTAQIAVTAAADVSPGVWDVRLLCSSWDGFFNSGAITAVATGL